MSGGGRLPDFVVIGSAKSGTTTLYEHLAAHPGAFLSEPKEPQFFSDDGVYARGLDWYRSLFAGAEPGQLAGEASTTYTRWPHVPDAAARLAAHLPDAKLVYLVRNPVDRAYSHYAHEMRTGVTHTFEAALAERPVYVDVGRYTDQLDRYLARFDRDQVHVVLFEDLRDDRRAALRRVFSFLGLDPDAADAAPPRVANASGVDHFVHHRTVGRLQRVPGFERGVDVLPLSWRRRGAAALRRSPVARRLERRFQLPPMLPATRARLLDVFAEPNAALAAFLGRDLSAWSS